MLEVLVTKYETKIGSICIVGRSLLACIESIHQEGGLDRTRNAFNPASDLSPENSSKFG